MEPEIDLIADLNAEDDDGLGWSTLTDARDAAQVQPGAMLVAGNRSGKAVVRVVAVDRDGQVHFTVLPGALEKNRHLIGRALARLLGSGPGAQTHQRMAAESTGRGDKRTVSRAGRDPCRPARLTG
jgi:hypothetical protein